MDTATVKKNATADQGKQAQRQYWDAHPISTDSVPYEAGTCESFEAIYANWLKTVDAMRLEFLESCRGRKVLEVGCGIGSDYDGAQACSRAPKESCGASAARAAAV